MESENKEEDTFRERPPVEEKEENKKGSKKQKRHHDKQRKRRRRSKREKEEIMDEVPPKAAKKKKDGTHLRQKEDAIAVKGDHQSIDQTLKQNDFSDGEESATANGSDTPPARITSKREKEEIMDEVLPKATKKKKDGTHLPQKEDAAVTKEDPSSIDQTLNQHDFFDREESATANGSGGSPARVRNDFTVLGCDQDESSNETKSSSCMTKSNKVDVHLKSGSPIEVTSKSTNRETATKHASSSPDGRKLFETDFPASTYAAAVSNNLKKDPSTNAHEQKDNMTTNTAAGVRRSSRLAKKKERSEPKPQDKSAISSDSEIEEIEIEEIESGCKVPIDRARVTFSCFVHPDWDFDPDTHDFALYSSELNGYYAMAVSEPTYFDDDNLSFRSAMVAIDIPLDILIVYRYQVMPKKHDGDKVVFIPEEVRSGTDLWSIKREIHYWRVLQVHQTGFIRRYDSSSVPSSTFSEGLVPERFNEEKIIMKLHCNAYKWRICDEVQTFRYNKSHHIGSVIMLLEKLGLIHRSFVEPVEITQRKGRKTPKNQNVSLPRKYFTSTIEALIQDGNISSDEAFSAPFALTMTGIIGKFNVDDLSNEKIYMQLMKSMNSSFGREMMNAGSPTTGDEYSKLFAKGLMILLNKADSNVWRHWFQTLILLHDFQSSDIYSLRSTPKEWCGLKDIWSLCAWNNIAKLDTKEWAKLLDILRDSLFIRRMALLFAKVHDLVSRAEALSISCTEAIDCFGVKLSTFNMQLHQIPTPSQFSYRVVEKNPDILQASQHLIVYITANKPESSDLSDLFPVCNLFLDAYVSFYKKLGAQAARDVKEAIRIFLQFVICINQIGTYSSFQEQLSYGLLTLSSIISIDDCLDAGFWQEMVLQCNEKWYQEMMISNLKKNCRRLGGTDLIRAYFTTDWTRLQKGSLVENQYSTQVAASISQMARQNPLKLHDLMDQHVDVASSDHGLLSGTMKNAISLLVGQFIPKRKPTMGVLDGKLSESILRIFLQLLETKSFSTENETIVIGLVKDLDLVLEELVSSNVKVKDAKSLFLHSQKFATLLTIIKEAGVLHLCDLTHGQIPLLDSENISLLLEKKSLQISSYERRCHKIRIMWEFGYAGSPSVPEDIVASIHNLRHIDEEKISTLVSREDQLCSFLHECSVHFEEFREMFMLGKFSIRDAVYDLPDNIEQSSFFKEVVMKAPNKKLQKKRLKQINDCKELVLYLGEELLALDGLLKALFDLDDHWVKLAKSAVEDVDRIDLRLSQFATDEMLTLTGILKQIKQAGIRDEQDMDGDSSTAVYFFRSIAGANELFKWWKKEMPSAKEFQMFLKLAHSSAGESDFEVDRIHTLDHIGDALAGFLYGELVKECCVGDESANHVGDEESEKNDDHEGCLERLDIDPDIHGIMKNVPRLDLKKLHDAVKLALDHLENKPNIIDMIKDVYKHRTWLMNIHASHRCDRISSLSKIEDIFSRGSFYLACDNDMKAILTKEEEKSSIEYSLLNLRDLNDKLIFFSKDRRTKDIVDFMKIFEVLFELTLKLHALKKLEVPLFSSLGMSVCCIRGKEDVCLSFGMWEHGIKFRRSDQHKCRDDSKRHKNEDNSGSRSISFSILSPDTQLETLRTISLNLSTVVIDGWEKYMEATREEYPILNQFSALQLSRLAKLTALYCVPECLPYDIDSVNAPDGQADKVSGRYDDGMDECSTESDGSGQRCDHEGITKNNVIEVFDSDDEEGVCGGKDVGSSSKNKFNPTLLTSKIGERVGIELQWLLHEVNQDLSSMRDNEWINIKTAVELNLDLMRINDRRSFVDCATEWPAQREQGHLFEELTGKISVDKEKDEHNKGIEAIKSLGWNTTAVCQSFGMQCLENESHFDHLILLLIQKSSTQGKTFFCLEHGWSFIGSFIRKLWCTILKAWDLHPVLFIGGIQCDTLEFGGGTSFAELGRFLQSIQDQSLQAKHHTRNRLIRSNAALGRKKLFSDERFFQYHTHHAIEDDSKISSMETSDNITPLYDAPLVTLIPTNLQYAHVLAISKYTNRFPCLQEVLICENETSIEDLKLFFRRAFSYKKDNQSTVAPKSFFLLDVENLDFKVAESAITIFQSEIKKAKAGSLNFQKKDTHSHRMRKKSNMYKSEERICKFATAIYIMCSHSSLRTSHFASAFVQHQIPVPSLQMRELTEFLSQQWKNSASFHMIVSDSFGNGKTWFIKEALQDARFSRHKYVKHVFSNEVIDEQALCRKLINSTIKCGEERVDLSGMIDVFPQQHLAIHLVLSSAIQYKNLDAFLFKLTVLKTLEVGNGEIWRLDPKSVVFFEVEASWITQNTFARHLKQTHMHSPRELLKHLDSQMIDTDVMEGDSFDELPLHLFQVRGLQSPQFLRVAKHLRSVPSIINHNDTRHNSRPDIFALRVTIEQCGVKNPSWAQLGLFVRFLDHQLQACDNSVYLQIGAIAPDSGLSGYKGFVVKLMVQMSRDFAIHSIDISDESNIGGRRMNDDTRHEDDALNRSIMLQFRRPWETSPHPYLFFNEDAQTFTFLGFTITPQGDLLDKNNQILEKKVMTRELFQGLQMQGVNFSEVFEHLPKAEKLHRLYRVFGLHIENSPWDPDPEFELTTDNCQKLLAMHLRFRCMIPVAMFGETGIGKTALLSYYSNLLIGRPGSDVTNLKIVHVDGGVMARDVKNYIQDTSCLARENWLKGIHSTILFFDECNTSRDALWLAQEIMCDQTCDGENIDAVGKYGLKIVIACNPYRLHPPELIARLESAGLGYHAGPKASEEGQVRLRDLVYRVHPLPPSLQVHIFDFGSLPVSVEKKYTSLIIQHMVKDVLKITNGYNGHENYFTTLICTAQDFMRSCKNEKSFVSLRDVKRFRDVFLFFADHLWNKELGRILRTKEDEGYSDRALLQSPVVCALGICYYLSLSPDNRMNFLETICSKNDECILSSPKDFELLLSLVMSIFVQELRPLLKGKSIAENSAFSENIFLFVICSELRIPLFLIGKPGTSKSLAKSIVGEAMQGPVSESKLFQDFSQCIHVSYQCSPLSTSEGIKSVFREASQYQKGKDVSRYVAMVVLDEIGLAEDSNTMALKSLHALLENGCSPDGKVEVGGLNSPNKVSFCGMSNWALDPAKMNRGVLVSREEPNREELIFTAERILQNHDQNFLNKSCLELIVDSYLRLLVTQKKFNAKEGAPEIYGLRDLYSFLKLVAANIGTRPLQSDKDVNTAVLYSILRNFKSHNLSRVDPSEIFMNALLTQEFIAASLPKINMLDLLRDNIVHEDPDGSNPVRYPLVITREPNVVLTMLEQYQDLTDELEIIHGAPFKDDHSYTSICRCIDRVKLCLETGKKVALINCGYIYESIYDAMNQYYQTWGGGKYVNLGLGTHRPPCRVHPKSRLIVFATLEEVEKEFPIPLINRLEKHEISSSMALKDDGKEVAEDLLSFCRHFVRNQTLVRCQNVRFDTSDCFIGFNEDTCFSIVSKVIGNRTEARGNKSQIKAAKKLLLESASPDSVIRYQKHTKEILDFTFCDSLLEPTLRVFLHESAEKILQVTTFSRLLTKLDLPYLESELFGEENLLNDPMLRKGSNSKDGTSENTPSTIPLSKIELIMLNAIQSESQLLDTLENKIIHRHSRGLVILQCGEVLSTSADRSASKNLIECTRFHIQNILNRCDIQTKVLLIIQLPLRLVNAGFVIGQAAFCRCIHIDELVDVTGNVIPKMSKIIQCGGPVSKCIDTFFLGKDDKLQCRLLRRLVWRACSVIQDVDQNISRHSSRVLLLMKIVEGGTHMESAYSSEFLEELLKATVMQQTIIEDRKAALGYVQNCWVSRVAEMFNMSETFCSAVFREFLLQVSLSLAKVIADWDRFDNLSLVDRFPVLWLPMAKGVQFFEVDKVDSANENMDMDRVAAIESIDVTSIKSIIYHGLRLHFPSKCPFFAHLFELLSGLWMKFRSPEDFFRSCMQIELNNIITRELCQNFQVDDSGQEKDHQMNEIEHLTLGYCMDLVQLLLGSERIHVKHKSNQLDFIRTMANMMQKSSKINFSGKNVSDGYAFNSDQSHDCIMEEVEKNSSHQDNIETEYLGEGASSACPLAQLYHVHGFFMMNSYQFQQLCRLFKLEPAVVLKMLESIDIAADNTSGTTFQGFDLGVFLSELLNHVILSVKSRVEEVTNGEISHKVLSRWSEKVGKLKLSVRAMGLEEGDAAQSWQKIMIVNAFIKSVLKYESQRVEEIITSSLLTKLVEIPNVKTIEGFILFESFIIQACKDGISGQLLKKFWLDTLIDIIFVQDGNMESQKLTDAGASCEHDSIADMRVLNRLTGYISNEEENDDIVILRRVLGLHTLTDDTPQQNKANTTRDVVLHVLIIHLLLTADTDGVCFRHLFSREKSISLPKILFAFVCEDIQHRKHVEMPMTNGVIRLLSGDKSLKDGCGYVNYDDASVCAIDILQKGFKAVQALTIKSKSELVRDMQSVGQLRFVIGIFVGFLGLQDELLLQKVVDDVEDRWRRLFLIEDDGADDMLEGMEIIKGAKSIKETRNDGTASANENLRISMLTFCVCDLYQRHGLGMLQKNLTKYPWLLPSEFQSQEIGTVFSDNFKLYGTAYQDTLNSISFFLAGGCGDGESKSNGKEFPSIENLDEESMVAIAILNTFIVVVETVNRKHVDCVFEKLARGRLLPHLFDSKVDTITADLFYDKIESIRQQLHAAIARDDVRIVVAQVLIHIWVVLAKSKVVSDLGMMTPFQDLGDNMNQLYLPGMESDTSAEVQGATGDVTRWYSCQCGENYGVGNCGHLNGSGRCVKCGRNIGRGGAANNALSLGDKRGHILARPDARNIKEELSERGLSSKDRATLFVILHSSLSSYTSDDSYQAEMIQHLHLDLTNLSRHSSLSIEDASLLVHALMKQLMVGSDGKNHRGQHSSDKQTSWKTPESRRVWELEIKKAFLDQVFLDGTSSLNQVRNDILDVGDDTTSKFRVLLQNSSRAVKNFEESNFSSKGQGVTKQNTVSDPLMWQTRERISISTLQSSVSNFTLDEQMQFPSITTIFMGKVEHQKRDTNKRVRVLPEAFSLIENLPDIVSLRDQVMGTLSYVAHEITTKHVKQRFSSQLKKLEETAKILGIWKKSDQYPCPKKLFEKNGMADQVIKLLVEKQNSIAISSSVLEISADMPKSSLISFDLFRDILPLAIQNARYSYIDSKLKVGFDFKSLEAIIQEKFLHGYPTLTGLDNVNGSGRIHSPGLDIELGVSSTFVHVINSFKKVEKEKVARVQKLVIESHERLPDYTESRDALAMILKFIQVRLNPNSTKTDTSQPLMEFVDVGLKYKLPRCLENLLLKEQTITISDCFWLFEIVKIKLTLFLRRSRVQTFTTQDGFQLPLVGPLENFEDINDDSIEALYWCAAIHDLLTFWASTQHGYTEDHATLDEISLKMRHPKPEEPLFVYLAHFGFGDFPDENVSVGQGIAVFEALARQAGLHAPRSHQKMYFRPSYGIKETDHPVTYATPEWTQVNHISFIPSPTPSADRFNLAHLSSTPLSVSTISFNPSTQTTASKHSIKQLQQMQECDI